MTSVVVICRGGGGAGAGAGAGMANSLLNAALMAGKLGTMSESTISRIILPTTEETPIPIFGELAASVLEYFFVIDLKPEKSRNGLKHFVIGLLMEPVLIKRSFLRKRAMVFQLKQRFNTYADTSVKEVTTHLHILLYQSQVFHSLAYSMIFSLWLFLGIYNSQHRYN